MINRYLNADPVPWLTDGTDPAATYLTKKAFLERMESKTMDESKLAALNELDELIVDILND